MGQLKVKVDGSWVDLPAGPPGPVGPTGPDGPPGPNILMVGSDFPLDTAGSDGYWYLQTDGVNGALWLKTAGHWDVQLIGVGNTGSAAGDVLMATGTTDVRDGLTSGFITPDWTHILIGSSAPTPPTAGVDNDYWLDFTAGRLYGPKDPEIGWPASPTLCGVPRGGSAGQVSIKKSGTDYDFAWQTLIAAQTAQPSAVTGVPMPPLWVDTDDPGVSDPRLGLRMVWENDSVSMPNNASENTLATFTIPAGLAKSLSGPGGMKWLFHVHALVQSTSAATNLTLRVKVNGTTSIGTSTFSVPSGTGERFVSWDWTLLGDNDYSLNQYCKFFCSGLMAPPTATDDLMNRTGYTRGNSIVSATWDSDIVLTVTAQWASATGTVCDLHGYDVTWWPTTPG